LGHSNQADSIRRYPKFRDLWQMIARTAFTQLRYSAVLLLLTLVALTAIWLAPPFQAIFSGGWRRYCGVAACVLAALSYVPTLTRYRRSKIWVLTLPLIALFFMAATIGSALNFWRGRGANWKNRAYQD
jgi:hypothetical protein